MSDPAPLVIVAQKRWWQSKTVWLNAFTALAAVALYAANHLTGRAAEISSAVVAVANIVLRVFFTGQPVTDIAAAQVEEK
jgi:hypothetical protein